jgi:hypothetical protein
MSLVPPERAHPVERYVAWMSDFYEAVEPLRTDERGEWQLRAYALADDWPLPPTDPAR